MKPRRGARASESSFRTLTRGARSSVPSMPFRICGELRETPSISAVLSVRLAAKRRCVFRYQGRPDSHEQGNGDGLC